MSSVVWLVHGILTNGEGDINLLFGGLASLGLSPRIYQYPHNGLLDQRSARKRHENAHGLLSVMARGQHVVAHSNGCGVVHGAMMLGARFDRAFLFGAALDDELAWPKDGARKINVIHNPKDRALTFGRLLRSHPFGGLGKRGYQGVFDERIHSIAARAKGTIDRNNHSHYFQAPERRRMWADYIAKRCLPDRSVLV